MPGGLNCGCICPSCKTPLIARKGPINEWCFAHQSRGVHTKIRKECDYSFEMSVRLMLRQLAVEGIQFKTPDFNDSITAYSDVSDQWHVVNFKVTSAKTLQLKDSRLGTVFSGAEVDVAGRVGSYPFVIYVTYSGREIPNSLRLPDTADCGVVEINLSGLARRFRLEKDGRFVDALKSYIEQSIEGKFWIYHPRYAEKHAEAEAMMSVWLEQQKQLFPHQKDKSRNNERNKCPKDGINLSLQQGPKKYICFACSTRWVGLSSLCMRCHTHLHAKEDFSDAGAT